MNVTLAYLETFWSRRPARGKDRYACIRHLTDLPAGLGSLRAYAGTRPVLKRKTAFCNLILPDGLTEKAMLEAVRKTRPSIAAFSCFLWNARRTLKLCAALKKTAPGVRVVLGGPDIPRGDQEIRAFLTTNPQVDAAVRGEGEAAFAQLLERALAGRSLSGVPGTACREDGRIRVARPRGLPALGELPSPLLSGAVKLKGGAVGMAALETSRGCPFSCSYCDYHAGGHKVRRFPLKRLEGELSLLKREGFRGFIYITDPTLNASQDRGAAAFKVLAKADTLVHMELSPDLFSDASIRALGKMKHPSLAIGVQSTHAETLRNIGRPFDIASAARHLRRLLALPDIRLELEFILGLPGDDYESFKQGLDWALSLGPSRPPGSSRAPARRPYVTIFDLVLLPNSALAGLKERFSIKTDKEGMVRSCYSFPPPELMRASWLIAAYSRLLSSPGRWEGFEAAVAEGRRPGDILELEARRLVRDGTLPEKRIFGQGGRRLIGWDQGLKRWVDMRPEKEDVGAYPRWW